MKKKIDNFMRELNEFISRDESASVFEQLMLKQYQSHEKHENAFVTAFADTTNPFIAASAFEVFFNCWHQGEYDGFEE